MGQSADTVLVKRYAGSRLYDMVAARYVTAKEIAAMAREARSVTVRAAQTGEDLVPAFVAKNLVLS